MSLTKKILLILAVILVGIQFIHSAKNQSVKEEPGDIFANYPASDNVKKLVRTACYDCHSNNTIYPWYSNIQPVAWWLDHHVKEGKKELNFSEFATFTVKRKKDKLKKIGEELKEKGMPLPSYLLVHRESRLTDPQREAITTWAEEARKQIAVK
ncbi:MAG TPA: cytochrome C [Sphingobacteriaceae bacterium]|nr:cytochrome C [Sphingobacteriaceae bacterium]